MSIKKYDVMFKSGNTFAAASFMKCIAWTGTGLAFFVSACSQQQAAWQLGLPSTETGFTVQTVRWHCSTGATPYHMRRDDWTALLAPASVGTQPEREPHLQYLGAH